MSIDTVTRQPPFLALPEPLTAGECMMLDALARQIAVDDGDYSHTRNATAEAQAFLQIAFRANSRGDYAGTHAALLRAASIAFGALVALDNRRGEASARVQAMHAAGAERIALLAGRRGS